MASLPVTALLPAWPALSSELPSARRGPKVQASLPNAPPQSFTCSRPEVEGGSPTWTCALEEAEGRGEGEAPGAACPTFRIAERKKKIFSGAFAMPQAPC